MGKKVNKQIVKLIDDICNEHYKMALTVDKSIAYLWSLRKKDADSGNFKAFIFLAEINLLTVMKFITEEEKQNLISLLNSEDLDNKYIASTSINYFRNSRVKKYGEFESLNNPNYDVVKDYMYNIINYEIFSKNNNSVFQM